MPPTRPAPVRIAPALRRAFRTALPRWFERNRRDLPWRHNRTPYRVWISELMLQQTRVDTVVPYYLRWMRRFPSVRALAAAPRAAVLKLWEGLGYYARARHAHDAAREIARRGGLFPRTCADLARLPGIGPYTAAAIASLAMGEDAAVVDGNVERVLARVLAEPAPAGPSLRRILHGWAQALLIPGRAGVSNEALMELGATVCLPRRPRCGHCPLRPVCRAFAGGHPSGFPVRPRAKKVPHKIVGAGLIVDGRGRLLIAQRREDSMLGGLWEFPGGTLEAGETMPQCIARELQEELGIDTRVGGRLLVVHHAYSHFTIDLHAHWARIRKGRPRAIHCADWAWVERKDIRRRAFSRADVTIIEALESLPAGATREEWRRLGPVRRP